MIAAIYIYENSYPHLFGEGHREMTINFGGQYIYKFIFEQDIGIQLVSKEKNQSYIDQIVREIVSDSLDLVTCIVGNNGAGKSTLLKDLLTDYKLIFIEEDGEKYSFIDLNQSLFAENKVFPFIRLYYSPDLNFESIENLGNNAIDISRSSQFIMDNHGDSDHLEDFVRRHKSANIKRWIRFNEFYISSNIKIINFPFFKSLRVELAHFRYNSFEQNYHDTPNQFRSTLDLMFKNIKKGPNEIFKRLHNDGIDVTTELDSFYKFKFDFYEALLGRIVEGFESMSNRFLDEGNVPENIKKYVNENSIEDSILYFLRNAYVYEGMSRYRFTKLASTTSQLINFINTKINEKTISRDNWRAFYLDYREIMQLIELYEEFDSSFLAFPFKYYNTPLFKFIEPINLSNGEQSVLNLFSTLHYFKYCLDSGLPYDHYSLIDMRKIGNGIFLLLDEADSGFHPAWKKRYIELLRALVPIIFEGYHVQIIITTHDPITLSDFPRNNIVYLQKESNKTVLLDSNSKKSFSANVSDLLEDSFFIENGLIGDWSNKVITKFIDILKEDEFQKRNISVDHIKTFLSTIDEPIIRFKLAEMYTNISKNKSVEINLITEEIKVLENRRKEIE
ncbi:AAA family ATPase [Sphingobacterium siyangense]|uniref:AAA family ATPase n=1 Tax=Sphingobacterium siyangense TaxID=459529 RepID=UPI0028A7CA4A|nr:AAA family ATPase [Sphingobacterium siyangense]